MRFHVLVWAGISRKRVRTSLTILSAAVAFLLFGLLESVNAGFSAIEASVPLDRLLVLPKNAAGGGSIPFAASREIQSVPGVRIVSGEAVFFGMFQDQQNMVLAWAVDAGKWLAVRPEYRLSPEDQDRFRVTKTGLVVTEALRNRFGWKVGDKIPFISPLTQKDGNSVWTFDIVGVLQPADRRNQDAAGAEFGLIHYGYFNDASAGLEGTASQFTVKITDARKAAVVSGAIDKLFENSGHATTTQSEREVTESLLKQLGDVKFITNSVIAAVFFTLLFVTANTMIQSVRERTSEFAVLKTIGFRDNVVFALVLCESLVICVIAAVVGFIALKLVFPYFSSLVGFSRITPAVFIEGAVFACLLALVSAALPAWGARKLEIVEALRAQ